MNFQHSSQSSPPQAVAVIGAGLAGLVAARTLRAAGCDVVVFEAGSETGGRLGGYRRRTLAFDAGAQYFTTRSPEFAAEVRDWAAWGLVAPWMGRVVALVPGTPARAVPEVVRYVGVPSMASVAGQLARDAGQLRFGVRVVGLRRSQRGWFLRSTDGPVLGCFDAVVLSTPAPVAADILREVSDGAARALDAVEMEPCFSGLVAYDRPLPVDWDAAFVAGSPLSWAARNTGKPGRGWFECWTLHATPKWTIGSRDRSEDERAQELLGEFSQMLGVRLPEPRLVHGFEWPHARVTRPLGEPCWTDSEAGLTAGGDWCTGDRVEAAYQAGLSLAESLLPRAAERTGG